MTALRRGACSASLFLTLKYEINSTLKYFIAFRLHDFIEYLLNSCFSVACCSFLMQQLLEFCFSEQRITQVLEEGTDFTSYGEIFGFIYIHTNQIVDVFYSICSISFGNYCRYFWLNKNDE